jgi:hypothetical protein
MEKYFEAVERLKNIQRSAQRMRLLLYRLRPVIKARQVLVRSSYDSIAFTFQERDHVDELAALIPLKVEMHFRGHSNMLQQHVDLNDDVGLDFYVTVIRDVTIQECTVKYSKRRSMSGWKDAMLMLSDYQLSQFSYIVGSEKKQDLKTILYLKAKKEETYAKRYRFVSEVRSKEAL